MSELALPEGWLQLKLGSVIEYGKTEKVNPIEISDETWVLELEDIERNSSKIVKKLSFKERQSKSAKNKFEKGDVLYGKLRPYLNKIVIANDAGVSSTEILPLKVNQYLNNQYLFFWLKSPLFLRYVTQVSYGVNMPRLGTKDGKHAPFVLAPLEEQNIIAQLLDSHLKSISQIQARLDAIPKLIEKFRQSVLSEAATGRLTKHWRESNKLCDWDQVHFKSLLKHGIQNGLYKPKSYYGSGSKIIRIDSFYDGQIIDWDKIKRVKLEDDEAEKWKLELDNILINRVNSIEYLGKCALVDNLPEVAVFESNIMRLSVDTDKVIPAFIVTYLKSIQGISELRKNAKLAVNQASINQQDVGSVMCPLPSIEEQQEIVKRVKGFFNYADQIEKSVSTAKARVDNLTQSILHQAFTGNLTADWREQNPDLISGENSAEALLAKIKSEKQGSGKKKSSKG